MKLACCHAPFVLSSFQGQVLAEFAVARISQTEIAFTHLNPVTIDFQIMYERLFESDASGDQCKFAETVREQSLCEYNELVDDIQSAMVVFLSMRFYPIPTFPSFQIVMSKSSRNRPTLSREEMIAQQARHDELAQSSVPVDESSELVTMDMALAAWNAVDCRHDISYVDACLSAAQRPLISAADCRGSSRNA